jgi:hypothetical protein
MAWKKQVLVVANVTATSDELIAALRRRAERESTGFTLIVPVTPLGGGRAAAPAKVQDAVAQLREAGLDAEGAVGDGDPIVAVTEAWDPRRYDEIIISTLPAGVSRWLLADLPHRVERITGAPVLHIISEPPKPDYATVEAPAHEKVGVLRPLSVLGWGGERKAR